jgi:hypothetical protein
MPRTVTWTDGELLDLLYREIDTDCVDCASIHTPDGDLTMWVSDNGLLVDPIDHNDRAIGICRGCGYDVPDVGGIAVFTGGADEEGDTLGIPEHLRLRIIGACATKPHVESERTP